MYLNQGQQTIPNAQATGAGRGGRCPAAGPPHGASPGPRTVPWARRPARQAACGVQSILPGSRGAHARGRQPGPTFSLGKQGLFGALGLCVWDDGARQFPGHQVAGLWPLWLETPPWHSCRGSARLPGPVRLDSGHRKKWAGVKPAGDGGDRAGRELTPRTDAYSGCKRRFPRSPSLPPSPLLNEKHLWEIPSPDSAAPRGAGKVGQSPAVWSGPQAPPRLWAPLAPPTARDASESAVWCR